jgi:hypothetical protein
MRPLIFVYVLVIAPILLSCSKDDSPVSTPPPRTIRLIDYGSTLDSAYYKKWSDSSWEKFNRIVTVNGITYATTISSDSTEYYYTALGYAGLKGRGLLLILFDNPLTSLPETLTFGQNYRRETTFYYQGYNFSLQIDESLEDTVSVSVPFGTFNPCLWLKVKTTVTGAGQSQAQSGQIWLARGPSDVKQVLYSGATIVMVRGRVNGQGWGMPFPKQVAATPGGAPHRLAEIMARPLFRM